MSEGEAARARAGLEVTLCPQELFCEMAVMGEAEHEANTVQRLLAALVRHTPASLADTVGVAEVFQVGTLSVIYISYSIFDIVQFIVRQVKPEDASSSNVCNRKLNDIVMIVFQYELLGSKPRIVINNKKEKSSRKHCTDTDKDIGYS